MRSLRQALAATALAVLGLVVGLGLVEGTVRLLAPAGGDLRGLHELRPDRPWLYGLVPSAVRRLRASGDVVYAINADGFRDRPRSREPPPGTFRIAVVGDSVAFGYGVSQDDTFASRLERRLAAASPVPVEVLNLGVNGYNPYTEAALFADIGRAYRPALVLVQFCVNDLNDPTLHFDASTLQALRADELPDEAFPDPAARRRRPPPSPWLRACLRSRACALLHERWLRDEDPAALAAALVPRDDPSPTELGWLDRQYTAIQRAAAPAPVAVVVFPYAGQLDGPERPRLQQRLGALGRLAGRPTIDLLPAFRAAAASGEPLFLDTWHPTARGHAVAAAAIADQLACAGLVPVPPPPGGCPSR